MLPTNIIKTVCTELQSSDFLKSDARLRNLRFYTNSCLASVLKWIKSRLITALQSEFPFHLKLRRKFEHFIVKQQDCENSKHQIVGIFEFLSVNNTKSWNRIVQLKDIFLQKSFKENFHLNFRRQYTESWNRIVELRAQIQAQLRLADTLKKISETAGVFPFCMCLKI